MAFFASTTEFDAKNAAGLAHFSGGQRRDDVSDDFCVFFVASGAIAAAETFRSGSVIWAFVFGVRDRAMFRVAAAAAAPARCGCGTRGGRCGCPRRR
uniref:Uncharacterized protein n=1 Tax=Romanomermis culicivorax TaxID=13658 RepID=A0A915KND1_ROMCU